ncbi:MAG: UDP-N-acetylmuramoyl-L-alanine--D-glutamate ligase [Leptospiraceae bacterium]|nr:UDP-N-acetylmuramoyl-L-alanine--D-glutamate ligase [Leptospiraceae bacterium]MCP5495472.1 UDP-N-acetylmuramoyl-L-alanine--D-glutamate ligase [Leptospiraceae bacterium]
MDKINIQVEGKSVLVLGGGISGKSAIGLLKKLKSSRVILYDKVYQDGNFDEFFSDSSGLGKAGKADLIIKSPGISPDHPILEEAKFLRIPIYSEIDLAYSFFKGKIVGITGTDGKSTTTALTGFLIQKMCPNSKAGGNLGIPFSDFCLENLDYAILELSSYQLEDSEFFQTSVSSLLNIAPDHLERHKTIDNYLEAKMRIIKNSDKNHRFIVNQKLQNQIKTYLNGYKGQVLYFGSSKNSDAYINFENSSIQTKNFYYSYKDFKLVGNHNVENLAASLLICENCLCEPALLQKSIPEFKGLEHRFQYVDTIQNLTFINDSKSTNIHSLVAGLSYLKKGKKVVLIIGGKAKGKDLEPFMIATQHLDLYVYLIGEAIGLWEGDLRSHFKERLIVRKDLKEVFRNLPEIIEKIDPSFVIFSPGCASFDQYKNFEERGTHFIELVEELKLKTL